ncbi:TetR/AcrR family transcriptional regulator [Maricaulaceae bacterium EIL42A08]|nr:TetR/AcrR family transcriptional regulator [Maricaulaceae bacterium EIL42A08]
MAVESENKRPTQEERTDAMRARLLEATLDLIAEEGWAQTSTQKICKRAGVSRGAQTHHFPTKNSLLIAAVREIVARYQTELDAVSDRNLAGAKGLEDLFDFLWNACFEGNLLNCWMDVMVAARTDAALLPAVRETDSAAIDAMRSLGRRCADTTSKQHRASDLTELTVYLLRGMVVQKGVHPSQGDRTRLFSIWKQLAA